MADLIVGAALGTLTSELYRLVENLIKNCREFNPLLDNIKATLESLKPLIEEIEDKNKELNLSIEDTEKFKDRISVGIKILRECSQDPKWYIKVTYTKKLNDLDESLKRQLAILMAHGVRDGKETLGLARKHADKLVESENGIKEAVMKVNNGVQLLLLLWILTAVVNLALKVSLTSIRPTLEETDAGLQRGCSCESSDHFRDYNEEASDDIVQLQKLVRDLTTTVDELVEENSRLKREVSYLTESLNNCAAASEAGSNVNLLTAVRTLGKILVYAAYALNIYCFLAIGYASIYSAVGEVVNGKNFSWNSMFMACIFLYVLKLCWELIGWVNQQL